MHKIKSGYILPSAAYTVSSRQIKFHNVSKRAPKVGDLVYGRIAELGEHSSLENKQGRIHMITTGTRAVFVYGNRYAPDYYEGRVPDQQIRFLDLIARSGVIGTVTAKNDNILNPTKVEILGCVVDSMGEPVSTLDRPALVPRNPLDRHKKRARMILHVGTAMNSGKSTSAIACCWALSTMGHGVRASKVTGTASLKDILHMQDAGAKIVSDFSQLGFPSTYLLDEQRLTGIFETLDAKHGNNPGKFWVVEFADGILQRETAMLLKNEYIRSRIHRLVFSSSDAFGALGGLRTLEQEFGLVPHAISGRCSSSPLMVRELQDQTEVPIYNNLARDLNCLSDILL